MTAKIAKPSRLRIMAVSSWKQVAASYGRTFQKVSLKYK